MDCGFNDQLRKRFDKLIEETDFNEHRRESIGTYKEKTVHLFLKNLFEPDGNYHEIPVGSYIADIKNPNGIIEIQTAKFSAVYSRWSFFSDNYPLTVVYPIAGIKNLVWINPEDGSVSKKRKSPKTGSPLDILPELSLVRELYLKENILFKCVLMEVSEYRFQDGWGNNGKRGSHRYDVIPERLIDIVDLRTANDICNLLPIDPNKEYLSSDFRKMMKFPRASSRSLSLALKFLMHIGVIERVGKKGNAYLYRKCDDEW